MIQLVELGVHADTRNLIYMLSQRTNWAAAFEYGLTKPLCVVYYFYILLVLFYLPLLPCREKESLSVVRVHVFEYSLSIWSGPIRGSMLWMQLYTLSQVIELGVQQRPKDQSFNDLLSFTRDHAQ